MAAKQPHFALVLWVFLTLCREAGLEGSLSFAVAQCEDTLTLLSTGALQSLMEASVVEFQSLLFTEISAALRFFILR